MPFHPIPGSVPLTVASAIAPPLCYFLALTLLPPFNHASESTQRAIRLVRSTLALLAAALFARLSVHYHVPWSIGLTYILNLTGWYGATRVLDIFFISPYRGRGIPRRVKRKLKRLEDSDTEYEGEMVVDGKRSKEEGKSVVAASREGKRQENGSARRDRKEGASGGVGGVGGAESDDDEGARRRRPTESGRETPVSNYDKPQSRLTTGRRNSLITKIAEKGLNIQDLTEALLDNNPVARRRHGTVSIEKRVSDSHDDLRPHWRARFLYAIDLETSMRGVGWSWTTADVRHTRRTWLPTLEDEFYQLFLSDIPTVVFALLGIKFFYSRADLANGGFDSLNWLQKGGLTLSQGVFLFGTFSVGYTGGALLTAPLRKRHREWTTHNLAYWPPLNSEPLIAVTTVREFWSKSWHRLFSRLFLVWGVWPGQYLERTLVPSRLVRKFDPTLDVGKVLGAFFISGIVHASAGISINGGRPSETFEWLFFWCSGIAVIVEEAVQRLVHKLRGDRRPRWYDAWVGRVWTVTVLLWSGQYFTRGWFDSGLVEEMVTLPVIVVKEGLTICISVLEWIRDTI